VQICYCLKAGINKQFLRSMMEGKLELNRTVLIVDEVDDLIVNERPNAHYVKTDVEFTPGLISGLAALKLGEPKPEGIDEGIWQRACSDMEYASSMEEGVHYRLVTDAKGRESAIQLDAAGNVPKVTLTSPWLKALNYKLCGIEPAAESHHACVCTPYVFKRYAAIFGLTGSVGGKAELAYLTKTYQAIKFNVPRFLDTCTSTPSKVLRNHGVELCKDAKQQMARVVELCKEYFREVPVLVICASSEQLAAMHSAIRDGLDDGRGGPHTALRKATISRLQGEKLGLDLASEMCPAGIAITNVHPGFAAHKSRAVHAGDVIVSVNGTSLASKSRDEVFEILGAATSQWTLGLDGSARAAAQGSASLRDEVQRLSQFDSRGASLREEWQTLIDDATKRLGTAEDHRCRVTVTDRFGGRGHDFQVVDKEANANGGMLVIATSIPDEREWIQWKGRTARQDRPGQFYVILDQTAKPFVGNRELINKVKAAKHVSGDLKGQPDHDARIEVLLDAADEGIGTKLKEFANEQASGEKLNAVSEAYYKLYPRSFDAPWPNGSDTDKAMRYFMMTTHEAVPEVIIKRAKDELGIDVS